jgi:hypothetical protein
MLLFNLLSAREMMMTLFFMAELLCSDRRHLDMLWAIVHHWNPSGAFILALPYRSQLDNNDLRQSSFSMLHIVLVLVATTQDQSIAALLLALNGVAMK